MPNYRYSFCWNAKKFILKQGFVLLLYLNKEYFQNNIQNFGSNTVMFNNTTSQITHKAQNVGDLLKDFICTFFA